MHIACSANSAYLPHAAAMLHSVLSRHGDDRPTVHFLHDRDLPSAEFEPLGAFVERLGGSWRTYSIGPEYLRDFPQNWRFTREAWFRALLPEVLPADISRVLYMDADTIAMRPLDGLWQTDLEGYPIGAVANPLYSFMETGFLKELGLTSAAEYFNSGMLLMDLERWRAERLTDELHAFVRAHGAVQDWPDQNALNAILRGRWKPLPPLWNAQSVYFDLKASRLPYPDEQVREAREATGIVHFVAPYKPWDYLCKHPHRQCYFEHLAQTPWRRVPIRGVTWRNRLLRLLPQPFMWLCLRRLTIARRAVRARL